jgi:repressor LexA
MTDVDPERQSMSVSYTDKQGQYLAFIYYYTKVNGYAPAEQDMQRYFEVSAPAVHRMIVELEKKALIQRTPRKPRSVEVRLSRSDLPDLE